MRLKMDSKKIFLILLIFSFSIQLFSYIFFKSFEPRSYPTDILYHDAVAKDFLTGKGLTTRKSFPVIKDPFTGRELIIRKWFPPGYSLYLSFLYKITGVWDYKSLYVHIFSLLLLALTVCLCFVIFSHLFETKVGLISAFCFCIYPLYLFLSTRPGLSEPLFFFVFYLSLWLFILGINRRSFFIVFLSGAVLGYTTLTKYLSLLYPLIISVYILTDRSFKISRRLLFAITFLSGYILCIIPWFLHLANKQIDSFSNYLICVVKVGFRRYREYELGRIISDSEIKNSTEFLMFLVKMAVRHFSSFFIILCKNLGRSWCATSAKWHQVEILLIQIPIILFAIWGFSVNLLNRTYRRNLLFCLFSALYIWVLTALTVGIVRIMIVCMPFVFVFSALGIIDIYKRIYSKINSARTYGME